MDQALSDLESKIKLAIKTFRSDPLAICIEAGGTKLPEIDFPLLLSIAKILGTMKFTITDEFEEGKELSEVTWDPAFSSRMVHVKRKDLNSGLPDGFGSVYLAALRNGRSFSR